MSAALVVGFAVLLLALAVLRASQGLPDARRSPPPEVVRRRAWLRRGGLLMLVLALALTGLWGGARDTVLLLAAGAIGGWALALTAVRGGRVGKPVR